MSNYSREDIINGLRRRDNRILKYIYKQYYPVVLSLIVQNHGNEDDAKDIFQEALMIAFKNIRDKKNFVLESSFKTYIYSIARLLWLKSLRNRSYENKLKENHSYIDFEEPDPYSEEDFRMILYQRHFSRIPMDCQQILKMSGEGISQKEIADKMGFKSDNYIKKRKHYCKKYLISLIEKDPDFERNE